jgi:predicted dehydrogenase
MGTGLRVAVAGASGIGKHHAKWHHACGSEVVAFLGSSEATCAATAEELKDLFGFSGRAYWDLPELLAREEPDIVDICTPNQQHFPCATAALEAGCHVLCEKPLVWTDEASPAELLEQAQQLCDLAAAQDRLLGICTQYAASLDHYDRIYRTAQKPGEPVTAFGAQMETLARGRERTARDVWIDMGPHPLSLLLAWMPEGEIVSGSLEAVLAGSEARAGFTFRDAASACEAQIAVRDLTDGSPLRQFGINGVLVECEGRAGEDGVYRSVLRQGSCEEVDEDFMFRLIRQFTRAVAGGGSPLTPGTLGRRNLQLQLEILAAAEGG